MIRNPFLKATKRIFILGIFLFIPFLILVLATLVQAKDNLLVQPVIGEAPSELPLLSSNLTFQPESPATPSGSEIVFLPIITRPFACNSNLQEQEIANLAMQHPDQGRSIMNCDPILAQVARERALDMGNRSYFSHTNPDGFGANYLVRQAGYSLPSWYGSADDANNLESIAAGYATVADVWSGWLNSPAHRAHILAESSFWESQTNYGIGYAYVPGSPYGNYWVFITAPPQE